MLSREWSLATIMKTAVPVRLKRLTIYIKVQMFLRTDPMSSNDARLLARAPVSCNSLAASRDSIKACFSASVSLSMSPSSSTIL